MANGTVLLTGGSGFIASHILAQLLDDGFHVVLTVRTAEKGDAVLEHIPDDKRRQASYVLVAEIAKEGAFDECIKNLPTLEYVIHTASPVGFKPKDIMKEMIEPAINGATGILKSVLKYGPGVKRVVLTSSAAAVVTPNMAKLHDESDWRQATVEFALENRSQAYSVSKTLAEKAAWEFMETSHPHFGLVVINNTWTFGPIQPQISDLDHVNATNVQIRDMITGKMKDHLPPTAPVHTFVDVRDVAAAHVKALTREAAGGKRVLIGAGDFSNKMIVEVVRKRFPEFDPVLPGRDEEDDIGKQMGRLDNTRSKEVLGMNYRGLEESVVDTVESILRVSRK